MPITQERIMSLAAEFDAALSTHRAFLSNLQRFASTLDITHLDIAAIIRAEIAAIPHIITDNLRDEKKHFARYSRQNEKTRRHMERKRRAEGVPVRTSPQYRANAIARQREYEEERQYQEWMKGDVIRADTIVVPPPEQVKTGEPALDAANVPLPLPIDDSSADPARWSAEHLAAEAGRGSINMDDEI